jgi:hypothetical protein
VIESLSDLENRAVFNHSMARSLNYSIKGIMANTAQLSREERKKTKRAARKKRKAEKPLKARDYPRGSKKPKVKKLARGQAKR